MKMRILDVLFSPWAIGPNKLTEIIGIYRAHLHGEKIDWKAMEARVGLSFGDKKPEPYQVMGSTAVIPVKGVLTKGMSFFSFLFGGSSMRYIGDAVKAAADDSQVKTILLDIDSPGGTVDGTAELAEIVFAARSKKGVIAYTDGMIASAAYWIASAADKIFISGDTVEVGSIGVVATHIDQSRWDEMMGDKYTEITAGRYKRIESAHKPLSKEGAAYIQDQVDYIYSAFVDTVARNRGISTDAALAMADGKIFIGKQAIEVGLVDGVSTFDDLIGRDSSGASGGINIAEKEDTTVTLDELKTKHPEVYAAAVAEGKTAGATEAAVSAKQAGIEEGRAIGATAERERITGIMGAGLAGHEQIVADAIADGKSAAGDVALKIVAAEKVVRGKALENLKADGKQAVVEVPASPDLPKPKAGEEVDKNLPIDQRAKAAWDKSPEIRKEFADNFEAYLAFEKYSEEGRVRILGKK
jgi:signal peptide peptidase SppA